MTDLHNTPEAVKALRDAATPGPWFALPSELTTTWFISTNQRTPKGEAIFSLSDQTKGLAYPTANCRNRQIDARLIAAAPSLASDYLTLHKQLTEARERIEALEECLDECADACELSYDATAHPANGRSDQELAAKKARVLLSQEQSDG